MEQIFEKVTTLQPTNSSSCVDEPHKTQTVLRTLLENIGRSHDSGNIFKVIGQLSQTEIKLIYYEIYKTDITTLPKLIMSIVVVCIKSILMKWNGYILYSEDEATMKKNYDELAKYLKENLDYILSTANSHIKKCSTKNYNTQKISAEISCTYRKLKTIIYYDIHSKLETLINSKIDVISRNVSKHVDDFSRDLLNCPFIQIKVMLPNLEIIHQNLHRLEYKLIKLEHDYKPRVRSCDMALRYKRLIGSHESFPSSFIMEYFNQVKQKVRMSSVYTINKKMDVLSLFAEFEHDLKKCIHEIETNTEYYQYLHKYPYVRYLGQPVNDNSGSIKVDYSAQVKIETNSQNFRLEETLYPITMFSIVKFNVPYKKDIQKIKFEFPDDFVTSLVNKNIFYSCFLCNIEKVGFLAKYEIVQHLLEEHGSEPNWYCVKCDQEYSARKLCIGRWTHECSYIIDKEIKKGKA